MDTIIRFFQEGGTFMYPIAIILAIGLAVTLERFIFLSREKSSNRRSFEEVLPMLQKRDFRAALNYTNASRQVLAVFQRAVVKILSWRWKKVLWKRSRS